MKKLITLILAFLIVACFASQAFAATAGTVTRTDYVYNGLSGKPEVRIITYTVTFGDGNAAPANIALDNIGYSDTDSYGTSRLPLAGWWLYRVDTSFGGTAPTVNTDFYLWRIEDKVDVLGGEGVDEIDAATHNVFYPGNSSSSSRGQPLNGAEIFDIDNNAVNDAITTIIFTLYR